MFLYNFDLVFFSAPPIESQWTKVVNMANTCETFNLSPGTVGDLIAKGI